MIGASDVNARAGAGAWADGGEALTLGGPDGERQIPC